MDNETLRMPTYTFRQILGQGERTQYLIISNFDQLTIQGAGNA